MPRDTYDGLGTDEIQWGMWWDWNEYSEALLSLSFLGGTSAIDPFLLGTQLFGGDSER